MRRVLPLLLCGVGIVAAAAPPPVADPGATPVAADPAFARDPAQPLDAAYTAKIRQYTTAPEFNTALTDALPASDSVPSPLKALGHVAGEPGWLPDTATVNGYFRTLAAHSPRVKVFSIGRSEEGREMIAAAIADESLLAGLDANDARLAQLADPRRIGMDDARANALIRDTTPVYYITGTIHSTETGAPTALMELAYRLAVDDSPYIQDIRRKVIVLITPVVETDGRDRMVDLYNWHRAHPDRPVPPLVYWGHYVAHDNNRDAMTLTLALSRNVLDTYLGWHAQVLHDLHESVPLFYDNTVGDGPYNAWLDPILVGEWQMLGWDNVNQMGKLGLPGVFTHGNFDTWTPGYLMFMAATHNGISRLYETFGNGGADTVERQIDPDAYARTWYKPNPPPAKLLWSQRNNNNYEQTGLLTALHYFAGNAPQFLRNFYLKSKRSVLKPANEGPAAYVFPADDANPGQQAALLQLMQRQHVELSRLTAPLAVQVAAVAAADADDAPPPKADAATTTRTLPAGSWVLRMDQPYSRIADTLLDRQYWAPDDPQQHPYDDTGWSMGPLFGTEVLRVTDRSLLAAPMQAVTVKLSPPAGVAMLGITPPARWPRIALMHTWVDTQTEGWWRQALDQLGVPYDYISTQDLAGRDLAKRYDVILFGPVDGADTRLILQGLPMWGPPLPWQTTALTPNLGRIDATPDLRPGMGDAGLASLRRFVAAGGLLVTSENTARFAIETGLAPGVEIAPSAGLNVHGSVLQAQAVAAHSPVLQGYPERFALYSSRGMAFMVSNLARFGRGLPTAEDTQRPTGRGGVDDPDVSQGRPWVAPPALPEVKPWQAVPLTAEQMRGNPFVIPAAMRPQVLVRYGDANGLLVSGLLDGAGQIAGRPVVVLAHSGRGNVLLFANNPLWRGETLGSWRLLFNAILAHDRLAATEGAGGQEAAGR
jgi:hypothetical protein